MASHQQPFQRIVAFTALSTFTPSTHSIRAAVCARPTTHYRMCLTNEVPSVLRKILDRKALEVIKLKDSLSTNTELADALAKRGTYEQKHRFRDAIHLPNNTLAVIAEIKRKSPSKGHIATLRDPTHIARVYRDGGANAISVLTDLEGFGGTLDDMRLVVNAQNRFKNEYPGPCPVLRKDFIIDEIQLAEAAAAGASAVLLIVSALGEQRAKELLLAAREFGLDALVEVHNEAEVEVAVRIGADIIGVNNRDLNNFDENLGTSLKLASSIPDGVVTIAESGISQCMDAWKFRDAGYNAVLVGEALVRAFDVSSDNNTGYVAGYNEAKGLIRAFKTKGSVQFGTATNAAYYGKGEGAKETLGEIAM